MRVEEIICDQCGARKGKTNHWWRLNLTNGFFLYQHEKSSDNCKDICGENCATRALQDFMSPQITKDWLTNEEVEEMR